MTETNECAHGSDGNLLDAKDIVWYNDPDDEIPINPIEGASSEATGPRRGTRHRNEERLLALTATDKVDDDGNLKRKFQTPSTKLVRTRRTSKKARIEAQADDNDSDDQDFEDGSDSEESDDDDEDNEAIITHSELAESLPSKTIPTTGRYSSHRKRQAAGRDEVNVINPSVTANAAIESEDNTAERKSTRVNAKRNPIYHFFEVVQNGASGARGNAGDKHYRCYHGSKKIVTVTVAMKSNLSGLVKTLREASSPMYTFFQVLKDRGAEDPITHEEIQIASGRIHIDSSRTTEFAAKLKEKSESIEKAFQKQRELAEDPWDQAHFEDLLIKWIIASDKTFDEVETPEFIDLLTYTHHRTPSLHIPGRKTIKRRVMDMGENAIEETKKMFAELSGKISISLDAWTSSNTFAFLAIVAHYVNKHGELEELLIDFCELVGEHSGENMAEAIWNTFVMYGIERRILALMLDNAANNDTLVDGIERRSRELGVPFIGSWARLRCMPHTVHLAAIQLLESIGALSRTEAKKARSRSGNYQDSVIEPSNRCSGDEEDDIAAAYNDQGEDEAHDFSPSADSSDIFSGVAKLRKIVRAVCSSPQRKQSWLKQVSEELRNDKGSKVQRALMLILDVRTRWSSTHQMMGRALQYQSIIDTFVCLHKDLRALELSEDEWSAISLVSRWLELFRVATTEMSRTKKSMLSTTHLVFRSLQDHIKSIIADLPDTIDPTITQGLLAAHQKLREYYYRFDQSPLYTWAALLDPRIMYDGMKEEYAGDDDLLKYLDEAKQQLLDHYNSFYASTKVSVQGSSSPSHSAQKFSFMARYQNKNRQVLNELEDYFKLSPEAFDGCDPLKWWLGRQAQYPNLYRLACDILAIPGSAVAVERIFSGGRDTISLRRASLNPDTIRTLMIVKQKLRLARYKLDKVM